MSKFFSSCFLSCLLTGFAFGQGENESNLRELVKFPIPPSPNAAALGKFGDVPVGLATGIPSISVPIFSWADKMKDLSLNIGLSYHAGGHKVEDMASNCGLGWALNAGGVISRTIRGIPDDGSNGYLGTPPVPNITTNPIDFMFGVASSIYDGIDDGNFSGFDSIEAISKQTLDGEFDIFNLSVGEISAKFFINKNGEVKFLTQTNLSITYDRLGGSPYPIGKFTLTDEKGVVYIFDILEQTDSESQNAIPSAQTMACISSYYISTIISADKTDTIKFSYAAGTVLEYEGGFSESCNIKWKSSTGGYEHPPTFTSTYSAISTIFTKVISAIKFPDSTQVSFSYDLARADYYGDYALTSVSISNESVSRKFNLSYDYFSTAYDPSAANLYSVNDFNKRLKLTQVQQISGTDTLPPYVFEYNSQNLPPRNSKSQDHWGYYNGVYNFTLIAAIPTVPGSGMPDMGGADRRPVEQYMKASVLEKITYPTGGSTKFTYHINNVNTPLYNISTVKDSISGLDESNAGTYISLPFTGRVKDSVEFTVKLYDHLPLPEFDPYDEGCPVTIAIKSTDDEVYETIDFTYSTPATSILVLPTNKTYQVRYVTECGWLDDISLSVQYTYCIAPTNKDAGGLRVEKTEDIDSVGNKITTEYSYVTTSNQSSGMLQSLPNYNFQKTSTQMGGDGTGEFSWWAFNWIRVSTPEQTLGYFRGSPVIYTRVKVKKTSSTSDIGYSIHEFSEFSGSLEDTYYPFVQKQNFEWAQGLELRDSIFNSSNQLVKRTENEWDNFIYWQDSAKSRNILVSLVFNDVQQTPSSYTYAAKTFNTYFGRSELKKTTEVIYYGTDSLRTVTEYSYDPNKFLLSKQRTSNSKGDSIESRLYYPFNYNFQTDDAVATLISKEMWKKISSTWYLTGAVVNDYEEFNSSFIKPKKIIAAEISASLSSGTVGAFDASTLVRHSSFKDQVEFLHYDNGGRYTEVKPVNLPVNSFIWSLNRSSPDAQVINATSANIAYTSFETETKGNWSYSVSPTIHPSAPTGKKGYSMAGGNITKTGLSSGTTYIITYWKKDSSSTITVNSGSGTLLTTLNGWKLYTHEITGSTSITISGTAYIDELRLYSKGASMTTYTYNPLLGPTSQCDLNNRITYYEYDGFGRLKLIRDQEKKILKRIDYKYQASYQQ